MKAQHRIDPVDADADIAAIMAKADRYEHAMQEQYGHLRMYAGLYKYVDARCVEMATLLREYVTLCSGDILSRVYDGLEATKRFTPANHAALSEWGKQRDALRTRAEELLNE